VTRRDRVYRRWLAHPLGAHRLRPDAADRMRADNYQTHWRLSLLRTHVKGRTLDGQPVALPVEHFASRYMA